MVTVITANDLSSNKLILVSKNYSSIYKFGLSVCLSVWGFVCLYPINVKTAEPIGPKFLWDLTWPQGRVMNDQNFKNLCLKVFYFWKIFKMRKKILWNPQTFFVFVLYCTKRRCSEIKPQLKVEIREGRKAP